MEHREPIFNVPGAVLAIIAVLVAVHVAGAMLDEESALHFLLVLALIPARYSGLAAELPGGIAAAWTSPFTHMLVHANIVHLAMNSVWLLAFGTVLCRRMGAPRFLLFSICGGLAAAALFLVMNPGLVAPMIGASGAIAAMMGATMRFVFKAIDDRQGYLLRAAPDRIPLLPLSAAIRDSRIVGVSLVFIGINLIAFTGFGSFGTDGPIAWEAHVGGYLFGFLCFGLFDSAPQNPSPSAFEIE